MNWTKGPLPPHSAAVMTGIVALMFSASMIQAYIVSNYLWLFAVMIGLYFAVTFATVILQLKNPASAVNMMRAFIGPAMIAFFFGWLCVTAMQGNLDEFRQLVSR